MGSPFEVSAMRIIIEFSDGWTYLNAEDWFAMVLKK